MSRPIRVKAVCLCRHDRKILLAEGYDPTKDEHYLMPIGGGVEFGELAEQAAIREVREEIGADVSDLTLLGVSENRFTFDGVHGHEVVFVFEGILVNSDLYQREYFKGIETNGVEFTVRWVPEEDVISGSIPVYPDGVLSMLQETSQ